jgi:hypothetical protein
MILAILEILGLLTVSCLIGIFFTYKYWKSKYLALQVQDDKHKKEATKLHAEVNQLHNEKTQLQGEATQLQAKVTQLQGEMREAELKSIQKEKMLTAAIENQRIEVEKQAKNKASINKNASKDNGVEAKKSKDEIAFLKVELDEKERELELVSHELDLRKIPYYRHIDGKRYKATTLNIAEEAIEGQGDGRISMEDAERIFDTISTGTDYTQVEKHTIKYLRDHYKWTEEADALFRTRVRNWAASDHELI